MLSHTRIAVARETREWHALLVFLIAHARADLGKYEDDLNLFLRRSWIELSFVIAS